MASISPTSRPGYVYDSATDTWIPIGIGPHSHAATDVSGVVDDAIINAKGDLIAGTSADTPGILSVGNNGETLVADSSTTTGLRWQGLFTAGKNKFINGDFQIWQRGTSFTSGYTADRWLMGSDATCTVSQQTFTPGSAPVAGYEGQFYLRTAKSAGGSYAEILQRIEDVRTLAGQTVTISFWGRVSSGTATNEMYVTQNYGSGGSTPTGAPLSTQTLTTSWQRFSVSYVVPSVSGKTIGTSSFLSVSLLRIITGSAFTADIWGAQIEAGSVATPFTTATGTLAGELAACQRYFVRLNTNTSSFIGQGMARSGTVYGLFGAVPLPTTMRTAPSLTFSGLIMEPNAGGGFALNGIVTTSSPNNAGFYGDRTGNWTGDHGLLLRGTSSNNYLDASSEL